MCQLDADLIDGFVNGEIIYTCAETVPDAIRISLFLFNFSCGLLLRAKSVPGSRA
jgi:hypothetical protein